MPPLIYPTITYRKPLDNFLFDLILPYICSVCYFFKANFHHPSFPWESTFWILCECEPLFVQVITSIELAHGKYMYPSQKSYIDRVRMRWEDNIEQIEICIIFVLLVGIKVVLAIFRTIIRCILYSTLAKNESGIFVCANLN